MSFERLLSLLGIITATLTLHFWLRYNDAPYQILDFELFVGALISGWIAATDELKG